ncbi:MAG: formimidoylglutamate deiminase [Crocinitomicaceae bacterium]|nr:formimidoylglutamate deiminase [Crocinitomicaceae bacterium]MBK8924902.1 formimidoylglutamate deiminase [Crocinitomicaceae bacterium]
MVTYKFSGLLQNDGWLIPAYVSVDDQGKIISISNQPITTPVDFDLNVYALPGFQNAHSHAFQYAMAGLAEIHSTTQTPDDFWSWREAMYQVALKVNPDHVESIATMLYSEMIRHGYTHVAEFHYLHHDQNGKPYDHLAEMGERLVSAAKNAGIGITLLPVFYQRGGFGKPATENQRRFISTDAQKYFTLLEKSTAVCKHYQHAQTGIAMHSLRGVEPEIVKEIALQSSSEIPFHIHISEQLSEVESSLSYLGKRPVEWMLENCNLKSHFHLVHATHLTQNEVEGIANSGAHVVLCPSTEGNLGDGIFPFIDFRNANGKWSIGTDSHIGLNPFEELRLLDYGQRLISHKRNTFYSREQGDAGMFALHAVTAGGRKAMNQNDAVFFKEGNFLDTVLISADSPLVCSSSVKNLLSTIVYSSDISQQYGTISKGKLFMNSVENESYVKVKENFQKCLNDLGLR